MKPLQGYKFDEAAKRYAEADKSDPFTYQRAKAHMRSGVASFANQNGLSAYYDAEESTETRLLPDGTPYQAKVFFNRSRP